MHLLLPQRLQHRGGGDMHRHHAGYHGQPACMQLSLDCNAPDGRAQVWV
jgi:hypothetical protein